MYRIIGADQKEYGPITAEQIRQWISEGRVNAQTEACLEGTQDWKPLGMFPEFGFTTSPLVGNLPLADTGPVSAEEIVARDYTLDIGGCISQGWELYKNNFGKLIVTGLLVMVMGMAAGFADQLIEAIVGAKRLPLSTQMYLKPIYVIVNSLVMGPAMGGLYYVYLCVIRGRRTEVSDTFIGFKRGFQDLFLGQLVIALITTLCTLPYFVINASKLAPFVERLQQVKPGDNVMEIFSQMIPQVISILTSTLPLLLICIIPMTYLSVNWSFTLALIVDKEMGFWTAMKTSWKMVHRHWFHIFGLLVLAGLVYMAGGLLCCIGAIFTAPISAAATMFAYETIFGRKTA
jgi:hypothetical protein